jgi:hypothetical protein
MDEQAGIRYISSAWRGHTRLAISDKHRTMVDLLADPATGGGLQHVESCLQHYLADPESDRHTLIRYAETLERFSLDHTGQFR